MTSVNLMLFTGQMFELAEIRQASGICDCLGCSQAPPQPKPYITAKKPAQISVLRHHRYPCFAITGREASSLSTYGTSRWVGPVRSSLHAHESFKHHSASRYSAHALNHSCDGEVCPGIWLRSRKRPLCHRKDGESQR